MTGAPVLTDARVAVLIVTYKVAALTIECLRSLASEREANGLSLRAYVVDNASGDAPAILSAINEFGWSGWVRLIESPVQPWICVRKQSCPRVCTRGGATRFRIPAQS